ncbi:MAG: hypothetical protein ACC641_01670 [Acidiferrobacterales bacterium]
MKQSVGSGLIKLVIVALALAGLSGCASPQTRTLIPEDSGDIAIKTIFFKLGMNRPLGSYEIKGSSIITGKTTKVSKGEAAFAGFGAMAAHSRGKEAAKKIVGKYEPILKYDLVSEVDSIVRDEAKKWRGRTRFSATISAVDNRVVELEPWVYLGASNDGKTGRVGVYLRAFLKDKSGKKIWRGGYNYQSPVKRPFEGANGWFANNGRNLKRTIRRGYRTVAGVMMKDSQGARAGWGSEAVKMRVAIPGGQALAKLDAVILKRSGSMIVYMPKVSKGAFIYGINVVPENEVEIIGK